MLLCNLLLILFMVIAAGAYSGHIYRLQEKSKTEDFIRMVESMKQFSQNYINNEKGYVKDWAAYISGHDMTMGEALEFLRDINANEERFTHIVDMDSYEAYSSYYSPGEEKTDTYLEYIRGYNFRDDYNKVNELRNRLENTESGVLRYKNFRETDCFWYYSSFGSGSALDILGEKSVYAYREPWFGFSANTNGDHYEYAVEFLRFLATEDEINKMGTIKGIPSVAVKKTENPVYQYVLNLKDPQMEYVNDGTITPKIMSGWYECTSQYGAGEFVSGREALEYFISSCKQ